MHIKALVKCIIFFSYMYLHQKAEFIFNPVPDRCRAESWAAAVNMVYCTTLFNSL